MRFRSALFILLIFIALIAFPQKISAAGKNIGDYTLEKYNQDRRNTIDAAENNKTIIHGQNVQEFQLNSLIFNTSNMIMCTDIDAKYCNPNKTAMGNISLAMQAVYANPPASLAFYTRDFLANAGLVKPAYAQGIGFVGLSPLLTMWKTTRNIAYAILVVVMIAIGFMIIFRTHIDPKTVISIQAALPKIVVTLILITFSYPIVGFLIDMMYVSMAIIISVMVSGMGADFAARAGDAAKFQTEFMAGNVWTLFGMVFSGGFRSIDDFGKGIFTSGEGILAQGGIGIIIGYLATGIGGPFNWLATIAGSGILIGIFLLVIVLGLLFTFIRLLFLLFNSYIQILTSLLIGPIVLLREAIPGQSAFSEWIQTIIANLVVFPATAVVLLFATFLTQLNTKQTNIWSPPLAGMSNELFLPFVGLSLIFMAPNLVSSIKKMFNPKPALPISAGAPLAPVTGAVGTGMGAMSQLYYFKGIVDQFTNKPQHGRQG